MSKKALALQRRLVKKVIKELDGTDLSEEDEEYQRGWHEAASVVKATLTWAPAPSRRDATLTEAAAMLGLEPGGMGTAHLEKIWENAYAEGQQNPSVRLLLKLLRNAGFYL